MGRMDHENAQASDESKPVIVTKPAKARLGTKFKRMVGWAATHHLKDGGKR